MRHKTLIRSSITARTHHTPHHTPHHTKKIETSFPLCKGCSGVTKTAVRFPTSARTKAFQASKPSKTSKTKMTHSYYKKSVPSKADLSVNWREPLPAAAPKPLARGPAARAKDAFRPFDHRSYSKGFSVFTKKPSLVNPYPAQPYLWYDLTDYRPGMKCELCKTTVRKSIFPQVLDACNHIFCAKCIHEHHIVAGKKQCPTCAAFIRPDDAPGYCRECGDAPCSCRDDCCPGCGYHNCHCDQDDRESYYDPYDRDEPDCPCGSGCPGDCGTLSCGCIDVCRGRCDSDYGYFGGW